MPNFFTESFLGITILMPTVFPGPSISGSLFHFSYVYQNRHMYTLPVYAVVPWRI